MNDLIKDNWKTAAVCAGGAFLLSLLVGVIARNPFDVAILRALGLAVLFAAMGGAARLVIAKFIPDLLAPQPTGPLAAATGDRDDPQRGTKVDIVLPEENGLGGERPGVGDEMSAGPIRDMEAGEPAAAEAGGLDDELATSMEEPQVGEPEQAAEAPMDDYDASAEARERLESDDNLDALPDISTLEVMAEPGMPSPRGSHRRQGEETPAEAMKGKLSGQDPATLAKAIRTVLKNEERG